MNSVPHKAIHIFLLAAFFFSGATRLSIALSRITNTPVPVQSYSPHAKKPAHRPVIAAYEAKHHSHNNEREQRDHPCVASKPAVTKRLTQTGLAHTLSELFTLTATSHRRLSRGPPQS